MAATRVQDIPLRGGVAQDYRFAGRMALVMLAINLIGFAPTLYLRPLFDVPDIPAYLYLHGVAGTLWFGLVATQALLINNSAFRVHRKLGWAGLFVALIVLLSGIYTSFNMVPRNAALGKTSDADIALFEAVTAADLTAFFVFPSLVIAAIVLRKRSDCHWRLLLMASICILGPALARIASWLGEFPNPIPGMLLLATIAAVFVHDYRANGRFHAATVLGAGSILVPFAAMRMARIGEMFVAMKLGQL